MSRIKRLPYANPLNGNRRLVAYWRNPADTDYVDGYYVLTRETADDEYPYRLTHHFYINQMQTSKQVVRISHHLRADDARATDLSAAWLKQHGCARYRKTDPQPAMLADPHSHLPDTFDECVRDPKLRYLTTSSQ